MISEVVGSMTKEIEVAEAAGAVASAGSLIAGDIADSIAGLGGMDVSPGIFGGSGLDGRCICNTGSGCC